MVGGKPQHANWQNPPRDGASPGSDLPTPRRRVVLLGASNVTLGLSTVVETARQAWGHPLEIMAAIGHGRSYGCSKSVLGRTLPGIINCGLWEELESRPPLPTAALVTDIGNDIIYGSDVPSIMQWVESCLQRLVGKVDRIVVTRLPMASISAVPAWKIHLLCSLIFPSSRIKPAEALGKAADVNQRLGEFANRYGAYVVQPEPAWYGWDPIHISRACRAAAWRKYMMCWSSGQPLAPTTPSLRRWLTLLSARPLSWKLFGLQRHCVQPTVQLPDGTTISLF